MKSLGKTIDRLIKIDPGLEKDLIRIKNKWMRNPSRTTYYWKELLTYLNTGDLIIHPKRQEMKDVLNPKKKQEKKLYSFSPMENDEVLVGTIPENMADLIRRHDRYSIRVAKMRVEATLTGDAALTTEVIRKESLLEINTKKIWAMLRDQFNLWSNTAPCFIRIKNNLLVVVSKKSISNPLSNLVNMDPDTFKSFLRFLGLNNPPTEDNE